MRLTVMVVGALLCVGHAQAEQLCKWVDGRGGVHYSDFRPPDRECVEMIAVERASEQERARALERLQKQKERLKAIEQERVQSPGAAAQAAMKQEARQQRCEEARAEVRFLEEAEGMRLAHRAEPGEEGAVGWIDDKERAEILSAWRTEVERYCAAGGEAGGAKPSPPRAYGVRPPPKRRPPQGQ